MNTTRSYGNGRYVSGYLSTRKPSKFEKHWLTIQKRKNLEEKVTVNHVGQRIIKYKSIYVKTDG